jgi:oxygen-independent coproporphyrinogen-3 oxidase
LAFGIYVHVPYCLQLCPYCDFTKYQWGKTLGPEAYTELVKKEIRTRAQGILSGLPTSDVSTVYFGGGTPSLLEPTLILSLINELANVGFHLGDKTSGPNAGPEISIEIDPATVDEARLDAYLEMGITRFSVGAQSFNDRLLKIAGRKHTSKDTVELLSLLKRRRVNYSFDLLFSLPSQTLAELGEDVKQALDFGPSHLSAYNLTVPEGHKLDAGRAPEGEQIAMFDLIESELAKGGLLRYEISNFAKPGFESKHNSLYWQDQPYWGVGLSSHSYLPSAALPERERLMAPYGVRFWNRRAMKAYEKEVGTDVSTALVPGSWSPVTNLVEAQKEILREHQSLTDFLHTSLRPLKGLNENALRLKFSKSTVERALERIGDLVESGWGAKTPDGWALTRAGRLVSNLAFEKLTFLEGEMN